MRWTSGSCLPRSIRREVQHPQVAMLGNTPFQIRADLLFDRSSGSTALAGIGGMIRLKPMPHADFVHLRVHSAYSLSEGAIKADKIPVLAREASMPALAITDTANLFGALEFSQACAAKGIQPIIGCQVALTRSDNPRLPPDPVVLLAQNAEGLANLQRLSSRGFL